jgi:hypothetical protein
MYSYSCPNEWNASSLLNIIEVFLLVCSGKLLEKYFHSSSSLYLGVSSLHFICTAGGAVRGVVFVGNAIYLRSRIMAIFEGGSQFDRLLLYYSFAESLFHETHNRLVSRFSGTMTIKEVAN